MKNLGKVVLLAVCLVLVFSTAAWASDEVADAAKSDAMFQTVRLTYDNGGEEVPYDVKCDLLARYVDTKEPIPLSMYYDGIVFATIPASEVERELELFMSEPMNFTDITEEDDDFYGSELSRCGVITGDAEGCLNLQQELTRSQAMAMIVRMLGISADEQEYKYQDISEDAWYYDELMAALKYKIVADDTKFNPNHKVTRQEYSVMVTRAFDMVGWLKDVPEGKSAELLAEYEDADKIAGFAKASYAKLVYNSGLGIYDMEYEDAFDANGEQIEPNEYEFAAPTQVTTREKAMELLERCKLWLPVNPSQEAIKWGFDQEMPTIDGSTSSYPFTTCVYWFLFDNAEQHPQFPDSHSKSHAAYERLINGEVDMLFAAVIPSEDILDLAKSKGVELELIPIAYDAQVFFTNYDNSATELTSQQIADIYLKNTYDNWNEIGGPDAVLIPYCRNEDSGSHALMEKHFLQGQEINKDIKVENESISMSSIVTDVMDAQTENPTGYGLGYSLYYYYQNMVNYMLGEDENGNPYLKLLSIDGVYPTDATIANGTYPLSDNAYVVLRKDEPKDSSARKMAAFMLTPSGQICVYNAGFGPLTPVQMD